MTGPPREKMVGEHMVGPWQNPAVPGGQRGSRSTHRGEVMLARAAAGVAMGCREK